MTGVIQYDYKSQYSLVDQPCLHTCWGWHCGLATKILSNHTSLCVRVCAWRCTCKILCGCKTCTLTTWGAAMDVPAWGGGRRRVRGSGTDMEM